MIFIESDKNAVVVYESDELIDVEDIILTDKSLVCANSDCSLVDYEAASVNMGLFKKGALF